MNEHADSEVPHDPFPDVVPILGGGSVRLRAVTAADLPFVVEMCRDSESTRWTTVPQLYDLATADTFLHSHVDEWSQPRGRRAGGGAAVGGQLRRAPCGFTHHGTLPQRVPVRDGTADAWRASLLPGEPMTPRHTWVVPPLVEVGGLRLRPLRDDDRAIADVASDDPLGEVLVFTRGGELVEGGTAELGDSVRPSAHGRGQRGEQQDARRRRVHAVGPRGGCRGP
ncbi:GNAT family N-acetyltransferase [Janibacter hoylei]|uniref:GNAT family N-acetyltransferase n=1 Tax=Janibacter hoylei TaxID=364298 RepID=UPI0036CE3CD5